MKSKVESNTGRLVISIDVDKLKLPPYIETVESIMENTGEKYEQVIKKLGITDEDSDEWQREVSVPKRLVDKFKKDLLLRLKGDIADVIDEYIEGNIEPLSIDSAIEDCASGIYFDYDDLAFDMNTDDIKIDVLDSKSFLHSGDFM